MGKHVGETLVGTVELDGNEFAFCNLTNAELFYRGGRPPSLRHCELEGCRLAFEDEAANTLEFIRSFAQAGSGFSTVILREIAALIASAQPGQTDAARLDQAQPADLVVEVSPEISR